MAFDDKDGRKRDPWGNQGGEQGPPDLDDAFRKLQGQLSGLFGGGGGSGSSKGGGGKGFRISPKLIGILVLVVVLIYCGVGFYTVDASERGVVLQFGKVNRVEQPGLRFHFPFVEEVIKVITTEIRSIPLSQQMLTEDENIVEADLRIQYKASEPIKYVVDIRDPEKSIENAAESALRHVVGSSTMNAVITEGREKLGIDVQERVQSYLDRYQSGIQVYKVVVETVGPPEEVKDAFDDVQKAQEDEQRVIDEANQKAAQLVPEARGRAQRDIEAANAYRDQVIAIAQGEADRFTKLLYEYQQAKQVTRDRLYITAMETVLRSSGIVMVDVSSGNNLLLLPLDQMLRGGSGPSLSSTDPRTQILGSQPNQ